MSRQVTFPPNEVLEKIDPDRRQIIEIIKDIVAHEHKTIPEVLIHLNYSQLPTGNSLNKSKVKMTRIIQCAEINKLSDSSADIKYSELLAAFKERFPNYPKKIDLNYEEIKNTHSSYYIYYYESYSGITERDYIKFGLVGLDIDKSTKDWESGILYYFNDFSVYKKFTVTRINPPEENPNAIFFSASCEDQVNFFTLLINQRAPSSRGIIPITYSVLETQKRFPSAGVAILEKIENNKYAEKIEKIKATGVNDKIVNAIYQKKNIIDGLVYENINEFNTDQNICLEKVKGFWSGMYFRTDFSDKFDNSNKGGICRFILRIEGSGKCELFWKKDSNEYDSYSGFVEFPYGNSFFMKIYLDFLKKERTYRKYTFLTRGENAEKEFSYGGIITGWINNNRKLYSSPVYIKKISELNEGSLSGIEELITKQDAKRIPKTQISEIEKIDPQIVAALRSIEKEFMATFSNCMPGVLSESLSTPTLHSNVEVYENRESPKLKKLLSEALEESKDILSIGIANNRLVEEQTIDFYKRLLKRDARVRIMFLDPSGKQIEKREEVEGWENGFLIYSVRHAIENLKRFKAYAIKNNPDLEDNIQWLCYDFKPGINALIIDKKLAIIHYYSFSNRGSDVPTLVVKKEAGNIFDFYIEEIEGIWNLLKGKRN